MLKKFIVIVIFLSAAGVAAQTGEKVWHFDADKVGNIPPSFTNGVGEWKVITDPTAPSRPNVLAQVAKNSGSTFNITLVKDAQYKDLDISVKMRAVAGKEDQGGGLIWRAQDAKNYYVARFNPLEDNYRVYKVHKGHRIELQSADIKHSEGWHTLRVTMEGEHIQCYYDGKKYLDVNDPTFLEPGRIGLWTKADAQSHFDDFTVSGK